MGEPGSPGEAGRRGQAADGHGGRGGEGGAGGAGGAGEPTGAGGAGGFGGRGGVGQSAAVRFSPSRLRLAAYALVVAAGSAGFWRMESTVNRLDDLVADNEANACVGEWQDYNEDLHTAPLVGTALIEYAQGTADPADIERFETIVAGLVDEEIREPECDLEAARAVLDK